MNTVETFSEGFDAVMARLRDLPMAEAKHLAGRYGVGAAWAMAGAAWDRAESDSPEESFWSIVLEELSEDGAWAMAGAACVPCNPLLASHEGGGTEDERNAEDDR